MTAPLTDLPVEEVVPQVRAALAERGVAVLSASPGAGKTTVVPLRLLDEPWLDGRKIVVLEPRRIAARAAARRMASLLGERPGETVGFRTRTDRAIGDSTRIEVVTEGILTRRLQRDPELADVGLLIFDEFHERSLQADLGLALALDVRAALRPDLAVLVMSATLDVDRVAELVGADGGPAPTIDAPGRAFPVEVAWEPPARVDRIEDAVVDSTLRALSRHDGDALVFMAGASGIRRVVDRLRSSVDGDVDVRPLFGALTPAEQDAAIQPSPPGRRKVVVSTDIAESSLTVDGVRIVVDAGQRRIMRQDGRTGMGRLLTTMNSRASADQRTGRAGRQAPGHAVRLWSQSEHANRPAFEQPEIRLGDVTGLVLELAVWGADIEQLALLDRPDAATLDAARSLLVDLGALDADGRATAKGRAMSGLPVHPRLASVLVEHRDGPDAWTACVVAAALEGDDVLRGRIDERPTDVALRVGLIGDAERSHPLASGPQLRRARDDAKDLARRLRIDRGRVDVERVGALLLSAFPDRLARRREQRGRFVVRTGVGASMPERDELAGEAFVVVTDLDGAGADAAIRSAAGVDAADVDAALGHLIEERVVTVWDEQRGDVVSRSETAIGALVLRSGGRAVEPGPETAAALVDAVRRSELRLLPWNDRSRRLQSRAILAQAHGRLDIPPMDDTALLADLHDWVAPLLHDATGVADVAKLSMTEALLGRIGWHLRNELDRLVPESWELPSGRTVKIDYTRERPTVSSRAQDFFGIGVTPAVVDGAVPLTVELLSPAGRPIQVTSDLAGFWKGSWSEVRKDMAGRYPKHRWPEDPSAPE